ncbi:receptor-like serine/threonine-protein kinase ALE2 isoform X2 [Cornus florida]|uniref:receptor-like serine/threonine-protein kinase ALE2 isoform X2 n=1 Tax=Cornus florida TaxID=4283 RepID=UPI0028970361|nr:receptor-like serine/threonine-protein kinase ALE2 isoform X2 [Cornus florida]
MRHLILLLYLLLTLVSTSGFPLPQINSSPTILPRESLSLRKISLEHVRMMSMRALFAPLIAPHTWLFKPYLEPSIVPAPSPAYRGHIAAPSNTLPKNHRHHHRVRTHAVSPAPSAISDCGQICMEPLTSTPIGSPCGCVVPMKLRLLFDVSLYAFFPVVNELEVEVAAGTYLKQSQVIIIGASADGQNQERTVVDINLVPLGEKFDNTTATLTYERFWDRKVPLNKTLFGNYEVMYISYPGLPSSPLFGSQSGNGPSGSAGIQQFPITADFVDKSQKMNPRIIFIIALSALVLLVVCCGAVSLVLKCRKVGRPSSAVGPVFTPSINKRSGMHLGTGSVLSNSMGSSPSISLNSTIPTAVLSVKTFALAHLEKATEKFSSRRFLGEGGFGRVYYGIMEDGTEVAVKLLTRDNQNGDREFMAEVEMLSRLHHRNLVKLFGICIEEHKRCLVYELVPNGSVESHLHGVDKSKRPLDWEARLKIALGTARGLAYLHEDSNPRVIHRDFKASNVLLEDDFTPKVSDFGLAREATEGSHHISTRVMGTFGYVAPEYAMTGHLLVKSDVYSYGVVLLELLSGRKPVDMSQPPGQENLVTWARPLLTSREGLVRLVDPSLTRNYDFDYMAKVAAIASMCVHPEVTHRPFMGEVVQALKLIYNDMDETCADYCSQKDLSAPDSDIKGDLAHASSFITMEYSSGPLEEMENRRFSASSLIEGEVSLPIRHGNRSGPLRTVPSKPVFHRLNGSMSEHSGLLSRQFWNDGNGFDASF